MRIKLFVLLVLFMFVNIVQILGQVNIKIGYNVSFPDLSVTESILSQYQPDNFEVVEPFGSLGFMHGIQLGIRYKWSNVAAEVGWENLSRERTALAYQSSSDSFSDRTYNFSLNGFSAGLDNYFGNFGIGSTLLNQRLNIDRSIGNNDLNLVKERAWNLRLHFIVQIQQSSLVSLMIKPYYQFALGDYNMQALADDVGSNISNNAETPNIFGISLVFYNGKQ